MNAFPWLLHFFQKGVYQQLIKVNHLRNYLYNIYVVESTYVPRKTKTNSQLTSD